MEDHICMLSLYAFAQYVLSLGLNPRVLSNWSLWKTVENEVFV